MPRNNLYINNKPVDNFKSNCELYYLIKSALKNSPLKLNLKVQCYNIYKYWDSYFLKGNCHFTSSVFFLPNSNTIASINYNKPYDYYKEKEILSLNESEDLLKHILILKEGGMIINNWEDFNLNYVTNRRSLRKQLKLFFVKIFIKIDKPTIIDYKKFKRHVYYVYTSPGIIYKYEFKIIDNRLQGIANKSMVFDTGDVGELL